MTDQHNAAHFIAGEWIETGAGPSFEIFSPNHGARVGAAPDGGADECAAAIAAAGEAFRRSDWAAAPRLRAEVLMRQADNIERDADALARLLAAETGKLIASARAEIAGSVSEMRFYAGLARTVSGRVAEIEPGVHSHLHREAAGVAGIITPWNAPAILLIRSLAPALAAGCTVVLKPAPQSSLFHTAITRCLVDVANLPRGVINSFCEAGSAGSQELVVSPDVDVISFTGSSAVGKKIMAAASGTLKRLNLELGGKASGVVFEDCDPETVAPQLAAAGMILSGQQCTAMNRVLVHESRFEELKKALSAALAAMKVGPGTDAQSTMGPLIDRASRDRISGLVETHSADAVLRGGVPADAPDGGAYISPSLLSVRDMASPAVQEEYFGPVMNIEPFTDEAEAIERANGTRYGLAASVWTHDLDRAHRVARALRSGTVWLNDHNKLFPEAETGGIRDSGYGRLHGRDGLDEFLYTKHVYHAFGRG